MTIAEAKAKLVAYCLKEVGYKEGANNWNKYAEKWTAAGGWNAQNQPWCDIFVDCAFIECFGLDLASKLTYQPKGGFSALCRASADFYKNNGAFYYSPEVGDQIFFYSGGAINHTGIVVEVKNGDVYTVEGNSNDAVTRHTYPISSGYIAGYGRPNWGIFSNEDVGPTPEPSAPEPVKEKTCKVEWTFPILQQGDENSWVEIMQIRLLAKGYSLPRWGADGDFGSETRNAVERLQKDKGLVVDSVVGQATWKALGE